MPSIATRRFKEKKNKTKKKKKKTRNLAILGGWIYRPIGVFAGYASLIVGSLTQNFVIGAASEFNPCPAEPGYTLPLQTV